MFDYQKSKEDAKKSLGSICNDVILDFLLEYVISQVKAYCKLDKIKEQMQNLITIIVIDVYVAYINNIKADNIKSITRGDVSYSFKDNIGDIVEVLQKYKPILSQYRRLSW